MLPLFVCPTFVTVIKSSKAFPSASETLIPSTWHSAFEVLLSESTAVRT